MNEQAGLSELQQAALDCIARCKQELANSGYYPRTAIELEFCSMDSSGNLAQISLSKTNRFAQDPEVLERLRTKVPHGEYVQRLTFESQGEIGFYNRLAPQAKDQYEILITEPRLDTASHFDPARIAACTFQVRQGAMQAAIDESSGNKGRNIHIDFSAMPKRGSSNAMRFARDNQGLTSGMHVNCSLYDASGKNIFERPSEIAILSAWALLQIQKETWPLLLEDEQAQKRLYANNTAPGGIGAALAVTLNDMNGSNCKDNKVGRFPVSMRLIQPFHDMQGVSRLENRLPGADSDPYVAMALTLASLVYAVRLSKGQGVIPEYMQLAGCDDKKGRVFSDKSFITAPSPANVSAMRDVLGDKLVAALAVQPAIYPLPEGWGKPSAEYRRM